MGFLSWIILGAIAGWLAAGIVGKGRQKAGCLTNIVVGIIGAMLGGFLFHQFGWSGVTGFNLRSLLVALVGSVVLLAVLNLVQGRD